MHVKVHVHVHVRARTYLHMHIHIHVSVHVHVHVHVHVRKWSIARVERSSPIGLDASSGEKHSKTGSTDRQHISLRRFRSCDQFEASSAIERWSSIFICL